MGFSSEGAKHMTTLLERGRERGPLRFPKLCIFPTTPRVPEIISKKGTRIWDPGSHFLSTRQMPKWGTTVMPTSWEQPPRLDHQSIYREGESMPVFTWARPNTLAGWETWRIKARTAICKVRKQKQREGKEMETGEQEMKGSRGSKGKKPRKELGVGRELSKMGFGNPFLAVRQFKFYCLL